MSPVCWKFFKCGGWETQSEQAVCYASCCLKARKEQHSYGISLTDFYMLFFALWDLQTCPRKAQSQESLRGGWQAKASWLCSFSQETADKETTGCPGTPPPPQHLTEQKQSHESLGIQRYRKGARRFWFVFASMSTVGLCEVRLLISAHLGSLSFSPRGEFGRHLSIIVSRRGLFLSLFQACSLKQLHISLHNDWHSTNRAACDRNTQC